MNAATYTVIDWIVADKGVWTVAVPVSPRARRYAKKTGGQISRYALESIGHVLFEDSPFNLPKRGRQFYLR